MIPLFTGEKKHLRVLGAYRTLFSYDYITFNQTKGFEKIPHKKWKNKNYLVLSK